MLDRTPNTTTAAPQQTASTRYIASRTAQNIAKTQRSIPERSRLAVLWMYELLDIEERTTTLAASIFRCSTGSVHRALTELDALPATRSELLIHHWRRASTTERAAFGRAIGVSEIWDSAIVSNLT